MVDIGGVTHPVGGQAWIKIDDFTVHRGDHQHAPCFVAGQECPEYREQGFSLLPVTDQVEPNLDSRLSLICQPDSPALSTALLKLCLRENPLKLADAGSTVEPVGTVTDCGPVPRFGFVSVAILVPGNCPDAPWIDSVRTIPAFQALISNLIDESAYRVAAFPVVNCTTKRNGKMPTKYLELVHAVQTAAKRGIGVVIMCHQTSLPSSPSSGAETRPMSRADAQRQPFRAEIGTRAVRSRPKCGPPD